ncbi:MAG TPA: NADH-quinone oxidoreductase subunit I [bacterium]|nr:NADH-quinone oxidoreductase subunit I [bacterium]
MGLFTWLRDIVAGFFSLLGGMGVTIKEFFSKDVTQQYPDERWRMADRFRGRVDLPLDPLSGAHKCTLCMMCVRACPNDSLEIVQGKGADGKARVLEKYIYKLGTCTLCELCVESCNFDAIRMNHDYEMATYDRQELTLILNEPVTRAR